MLHNCDEFKVQICSKCELGDVQMLHSGSTMISILMCIGEAMIHTFIWFKWEHKLSLLFLLS